MTPKVFSGLILLLLLTAEVFPQLNEFSITPQPAPAVVPVFTSYPDKAAIIIYSVIEDIQFESNTDGILNILSDNTSGKVILIVTPESQFIKVRKQDFLEGVITIPTIRQKQVLYYTIEQKQNRNNLIPVLITSDPAGADIYIDGEFVGNINKYNLPAGEHKITAFKADFGMNELIVNVSETNNYFEIKLNKISLVSLNISSTPNGAIVFLDEVIEGKTDFQVFKMPGTYKIKVLKSGYLPEEEEITILPKTPLTRNYNLIKNTGILNITVDPSDSRVKLNNKEITQLTNVELAPGTYKIEAEKKGYFTKEELIEIELNKTVDKSITLDKGKKGSLELIVKPIDATGELKYEGITVRIFTGSQFFKDLPEGEYTLHLRSEGHWSYERSIFIKQNEIINHSANLTMVTFVPEGFVFVQGGTFLMGNNDTNNEEGQSHQVTLSDFFIAKHEVSEKLWNSVKGYYSFDMIDNHPARFISWYAAVEFCNKLSDKEGLQKVYTLKKNQRDTLNKNKNDDYDITVRADFTANGYRLPTEAEWEYAARGGSLSKGYTYSGSNNAGNVAWYNENSGGEIQPVGQKQANELGIYDMSGNVAEWCWDWYNQFTPEPQMNPTGSPSGSDRIIRGGDFFSSLDTNEHRVSVRNSVVSHAQGQGIGFRIVRSK